MFTLYHADCVGCEDNCLYPHKVKLKMFSLEMFENIAYVMAKHADPQGVPDTPEECLDGFNTFMMHSDQKFS